MVVFSPNGTETYTWTRDDEIPQKTVESTKSEAETLDDGQDSENSPSTSSNSQGLPNGMVWDGKQWTYNPSGFKPAYPPADDDKTK